MRPIFILGPTASGKHEAALLVAERLGAEIVSIDSMKVYRGMDIGTAKPPREALQRVRHHLIDTCDPAEVYNAGRFVRDARLAQAEIESRGRPALFVGGTSLYYKAYVYGIFDGPGADPELRRELATLGAPALHSELSRVDPAAAKRIHPNDLKRLMRAVEVYRKTGVPISARQTHFDRPKLDATVICLWRERDELKARIERRVQRMMREGLIDEVRRLSAAAWSPEGRAAVGYREVLDHLEGPCALEEVEPQIARDTWKFARRQFMWFRSFKESKAISWGSSDTPETAAAKIMEAL
ncbi:MAG: tRNA (adenosine(37)-N6)-dimethylallyltransferase MiaA [Planctomycetes bacterium]|nr:tRNA (adenosine(37)-N6)-dimethylallyltransferase MiaA [Planctomycetota bacterium]